MVCIQVYAPTGEHSDSEVEMFYEDVKSALKQVKKDDILIVMGDMNAKVGDEKFGSTVGNYGLGSRNDRGTRFVQFCEENELVITNTFFKHHPRRLYTWKSPGDVHRNQIDFITIKKRYRNTVKNAMTYPGADMNSDHNPVVVKLKFRLKNTSARLLRKPKFQLELLKDTEIKSRYSAYVSNRYQELMQEETEQCESVKEEIDKEWKCLKLSMEEAMKEVVPRTERQRKQDWMTDDILDLMDDRRKVKIQDPNEYKRLDRDIRMRCKNRKEEWYGNLCSEIEDLERRHNSRLLHKKVKDLVDRRKGIKSNSGCIRDKTGKLLFEQQEIEKIWVEYISELYDDEQREARPIYDDNTGPSITKEEVIWARKKLKDGKTAGSDDITTEGLKALGHWFLTWVLPPPMGRC